MCTYSQLKNKKKHYVLPPPPPGGQWRPYVPKLYASSGIDI